MIKKTCFILTTLALLLYSTNVFAIVTSWNYDISAIFVDSTFSGTNYIETDTSLTWGESTGQGRSSLVLDPSGTIGTVDTYIGDGIPSSSYWADNISITHNNFPITGTSLLTTTIRSTVTLNPDAYNGPASFDVDIKFAETPNASEYPNDVFAIVNNFPNLSFTYDDGDGLLTYFVNIFPSDGSVLSALTGAYAGLVGVEDGTLGFTTVEGLSTTLPFVFTISAEPLTVVPEPTTLVLLGGGLIGLAFYSRRRQQ